jgi:hypothetical protein
MPDIIRCHVCGVTRDTEREPYCKKCMDQFISRTPPNKMLHRERIREAEFISEYLLKDNIPYELKWRRLEELSGRKVKEGELSKDIAQEISEQDKYPGMPKHLLKKESTKKDPIIVEVEPPTNHSVIDDNDDDDPFDNTQLGWTNASVAILYKTGVTTVYLNGFRVAFGGDPNRALVIGRKRPQHKK